MSDTSQINQALREISGFSQKEPKPDDRQNINQALRDVVGNATNYMYSSRFRSESFKPPQEPVSPTPEQQNVSAPPPPPPPPPPTPAQTTVQQPTPSVQTKSNSPVLDTIHDVIFGVKNYAAGSLGFIDKNTPILGGIIASYEESMKPTETGHIEDIGQVGNTINQVVSDVMAEPDPLQRVVKAEFGALGAITQAVGMITGTARDLPGFGREYRNFEMAMNMLGKPFEVLGKPAAGLAGAVLGQGLNNLGSIVGLDKVTGMPLQNRSILDPSWRSDVLAKAGFNDESFSAALNKDLVGTLATLGNANFDKIDDTPAGKSAKLVLSMMYDPLNLAGAVPLLNKVSHTNLLKSHQAHLIEDATLSVPDAIAFVNKYGGVKEVAKTAKEIEQAASKVSGAERATLLETAKKMRDSVSLLNRHSKLLKGKNFFDPQQILDDGLLLTHESRIIETVRTAAENVLPKIWMAKSRDEILSALRLYTIAKDEESLRVAASVVPNLDSLHGLRAVKLMSGYSDNLDNLEKFFAQIDDLIANPSTGIPKDLKASARDLVQAVRDGKATEADVLKYTKHYITNDLGDYVAQSTNSIWKANVSPKAMRIVNRLFAEMRGFEAIGYIGLSPITFLHNWINNKATALIEGSNPFWNLDNTIRQLREAGKADLALELENAREMQSYLSGTTKASSLGAILGGGSVETIVGKVSRARRAERYAAGYTGKLSGVAAKLANKVPTMRWYGQMEAAQRARMWLETYHKVMKNWHSSNWMPKLSESTRAMLQELGVNEQIIEDAIGHAGRSNMDAAAMTHYLDGVLRGQYSSGINTSELAAAAGMTEKELLSHLMAGDEETLRRLLEGTDKEYLDFLDAIEVDIRSRIPKNKGGAAAPTSQSPSPTQPPAPAAASASVPPTSQPPAPPTAAPVPAAPVQPQPASPAAAAPVPPVQPQQAPTSPVTNAASAAAEEVAQASSAPATAVGETVPASTASQAAQSPAAAISTTPAAAAQETAAQAAAQAQPAKPTVTSSPTVKDIEEAVAKPLPPEEASSVSNELKIGALDSQELEEGLKQGKTVPEIIENKRAELQQNIEDATKLKKPESVSPNAEYPSFSDEWVYQQIEKDNGEVRFHLRLILNDTPDIEAYNAVRPQKSALKRGWYYRYNERIKRPQDEFLQGLESLRRRIEKSVSEGGIGRALRNQRGVMNSPYATSKNLDEYVLRKLIPNMQKNTPELVTEIVDELRAQAQNALEQLRRGRYWDSVTRTYKTFSIGDSPHIGAMNYFENFVLLPNRQVKLLTGKNLFEGPTKEQIVQEAVDAAKRFSSELKGEAPKNAQEYIARYLDNTTSGKPLDKREAEVLNQWLEKNGAEVEAALNQIEGTTATRQNAPTTSPVETSPQTAALNQIENKTATSAAETTPVQQTAVPNQAAAEAAPQTAAPNQIAEATTPAPAAEETTAAAAGTTTTPAASLVEEARQTAQITPTEAKPPTEASIPAVKPLAPEGKSLPPPPLVSKNKRIDIQARLNELRSAKTEEAAALQKQVKADLEGEAELWMQRFMERMQREKNAAARIARAKENLVPALYNAFPEIPNPQEIARLNMTPEDYALVRDLGNRYIEIEAELYRNLNRTAEEMTFSDGTKFTGWDTPSQFKKWPEAKKRMWKIVSGSYIKAADAKYAELERVYQKYMPIYQDLLAQLNPIEPLPELSREDFLNMLIDMTGVPNPSLSSPGVPYKPGLIGTRRYKSGAAPIIEDVYRKKLELPSYEDTDFVTQAVARIGAKYLTREEWSRITGLPPETWDAQVAKPSVTLTIENKPRPLSRPKKQLELSRMMDSAVANLERSAELEARAKKLPVGSDAYEKLMNRADEANLAAERIINQYVQEERALLEEEISRGIRDVKLNWARPQARMVLPDLTPEQIQKLREEIAAARARSGDVSYEIYKETHNFVPPTPPERQSLIASNGMLVVSRETSSPLLAGARVIQNERLIAALRAAEQTPENIKALELLTKENELLRERIQFLEQNKNAPSVVASMHKVRHVGDIVQLPIQKAQGWLSSYKETRAFDNAVLDAYNWAERHGELEKLSAEERRLFEQSYSNLVRRNAEMSRREIVTAEAKAAPKKRLIKSEPNVESYRQRVNDLLAEIEPLNQRVARGDKLGRSEYRNYEQLQYELDVAEKKLQNQQARWMQWKAQQTESGRSLGSLTPEETAARQETLRSILKRLHEEGWTPDPMLMKGEEADAVLRMLTEDPRYKTYQMLVKSPYDPYASLGYDASKRMRRIEEAYNLFMDAAKNDPTLSAQVQHVTHQMFLAKLAALHSTLPSSRLRYLYGLTDAARNRIMAEVRKIYAPALGEARQAAMMMADSVVNAALLNYDRRYIFDEIMGYLAPFTFWRTHYGIETIRRMLDKPALAATYIHLRDALDSVENDPNYPTRLRGRTEIPLPFAEKWMGGSMFFDPLEQVMPLKQVFGRDSSSQQQFVSGEEVSQVLYAMAASGQITVSEAANAIADQENSDLWNHVYKELEARQSEQVGSLEGLFRPHVPFDIAFKLLTGHGDQVGVILPATRLVRAAGTAVGVQNLNIESGVKSGLNALVKPLGDIGYALDLNKGVYTNVPQWDMWEEYRAEREIANLVAEGQYGVRDGLLALIEHKGPVWEEALRRVSKIQLTQTASLLGGMLFPEGERTYYTDKNQRNLLLDKALSEHGLNPAELSASQKWQAASQLGLTKRGTELGDFIASHPSVQMYSSVFDEAEQRLKQFFISELWSRYNSMSLLDRRMARQFIGKEFADMIASEKRDYSQYSIEQLAEWAQKLHGYNPQQQKVPVPTIDEGNQYKFVNPDMAKRYQEFRDTMDKAYDWDTLGPQLEEYNAIPSADRAKRTQYRLAHPSLDSYLKAYGAFMRRNPDIAKMLNPDYSVITPQRYGRTTSEGRLIYNRINQMIRAIAGRETRSGSGFHRSANSPFGLTETMKSELRKLAQNPSYRIPKGIYGQLFSLYRRYRLGAKSFREWLILIQQYI